MKKKRHSADARITYLVSTIKEIDCIPCGGTGRVPCGDGKLCNCTVCGGTGKVAAGGGL